MNSQSNHHQTHNRMSSMDHSGSNSHAQPQGQLQDKGQTRSREGAPVPPKTPPLGQAQKAPAARAAPQR